MSKDLIIDESHSDVNAAYANAGKIMTNVKKNCPKTKIQFKTLLEMGHYRPV